MTRPEPVAAYEFCLEQCHASVDILQSVVEKLRLLPYPVAASREQYVQLASKSISLNEAGRQCVVFGLALVALRNALRYKSVSLTTKLRQAIKKFLTAAAQLRDKVNTSLDTLLGAASDRSVSSDKYLRTFFKIMQKIEKLLHECSSRLDTLLEGPYFSSRARLSHFVKQLSIKLDGGIFSLQIEDIHEQLERQAIEEARLNTEAALTSATKQLAELSVQQAGETHGATVKRIMDPSFISNRIATQSGAEVIDKPSKTVGPRTASTKREPFWKLDGATPVKEQPCLTMQNVTKSKEEGAGTSQQQQASMPLANTNQPVGHTVQNGQRVVSVTIDEVYDSYHDHAADATLGLAGSNAIAALRRQPSHKMKLTGRTMARAQSFTDLHRRAREAKARDKENAIVIEPRVKSAARTGLRKAATMESSSPKPLRDTSNRQVTPMSIDKIRDQYY